jgi:glycosyltransferase involved in cell wall biosynthesis
VTAAAGPRIYPRAMLALRAPSCPYALQSPHDVDSVVPIWELLRFFDLLRPGSNGAGMTIAEADRKRDKRLWAEAAALYRTALRKEPGLAPIWVQLGHALKESGDYQGAESAYKRSLELLDVADTHLQLGHLYKLMKRHSGSEQGYLKALERQPDLKDARDELRRMGWNQARLRIRIEGRNDSEELQSTLAHISFELSDLVDFLQGARYPTGIQRVQLELAAALMARYRESDVQFIYYDHGRYAFVEVDRDQISDIVHLVDNADRPEARRLDIARQLKSDILLAPDFAFPPNSTLVNVGTSWGYWNYMLSVRHTKRRYGIKFAPLVHDCIPLLFPEFCDKRLIEDFLNWLIGMLPQADLLFSNSENTLRDAKAFASQLEIAAPPRSSVLRLNGKFLSNAVSASPEAEEDARDLLRLRKLDSDEYVLFVSTIEPRKNHVIALNAWSRMLKRKDGRKVPKLVCVGNPGWMNDAFHQRLEGDQALNERVVVLHNVSDQALRLLYEKCAFTIFPSLYEGWGLPISEALSYGKVPLVSRVSSHPEAGGELAEYFDLGAEADFQTQLDKLIYDRTFRKQREEMIRGGRPLRPWSEIGAELVAAVEEMAATGSDATTSHTAPQIECGRLYSFARNSASRIADLLLSGDVYRDGINWHASELWGCWVRGKSADVTFSLPKEMGNEFLVFLQMVGLNSVDNTVVVSVPGTEWSVTLILGAGTIKWEKIPVVFSADNSVRTVSVRISAQRLHNFSKDTEGDLRESGFGVKAIYVCQTDNTLHRQGIVEAIALGSTNDISGRFARVAKL